MSVFKKENHIVYWDAEHNEVAMGTVKAVAKDYYGDESSLLVDGPRGDVGVARRNILYLGDLKHMPIGFTRWFDHQFNVTEKLTERIDKLEKSHQLMIATLKAVRDILQEGKEDGKAKTCRGVCSGGCSGDHKSCHSHRVQKPR